MKKELLQMIKKALILIGSVMCILFLFYLSWPSPVFPTPPTGALRSIEPGDNETPLRQAYYTDATRDEVMANYIQQFEKPMFMGLPFLTERLNHPPEGAQTIIRDQTKSTFLEELVHPFRESIYINGFEPKDGKVILEVGSVRYRQKITVKYLPSSIYMRFFIGALIITMLYILINEYKKI